MLAKQVSGDLPKTALLEKIAKQTFRASEIVNSLLNFSRTGPTELTDLDLAKVMREVLSLIGHQLDQTQIVTRLEVQPDLPAIRGNSGKLQQVFLNLFLNARDAMEAGGRLSIEAWAESGTVRIDVQDTGVGMPLHVAQRVFDPFFTTKGAKKGTGLGLSVTYGIVEEHGGTIEVESRPGDGTLFRLMFPQARPGAATSQAGTSKVNA
jgi:signal transduction histidine kinase